MSGFVLKIFALIFMIMDHSAAVFDEYIPIWFRFIGRMAFPIYSFLIAQGCKYTKDIKKYMMRLGILAIISEIPYDLALNKVNNTYDINYFNNLNTVFTLFTGVLTVYFFKEINKHYKHKIFTFIILICSMIIADIFEMDYGSLGILIIFCFYMVDEKRKQIIYFALIIMTKYYRVIIGTIFKLIGLDYMQFTVYANRLNLSIVVFTLFAIIPIYFYNGERGIKSKYMFYVAYPLHLIIIFIIEYLI